MLIKYVGARKSANIVCSGRATYYFGLENDYIVDITDMKHVTQILKSILHKCIVVTERPKKEKPKKTEVPKVPPVEKPKAEKPEKPEAPKAPAKPKSPAKKPKTGKKGKK